VIVPPLARNWSVDSAGRFAMFFLLRGLNRPCGRCGWNWSEGIVLRYFRVDFFI